MKKEKLSNKGTVMKADKQAKLHPQKKQKRKETKPTKHDSAWLLKKNGQAQWQQKTELLFFDQ